ncbi:MAG: asparagine synthase (glutamine-hydrolyzing) [Gammaproteobacteria bacterium]|nr:asparagine synthase (glutamine-hydrolyzing) [Gammaproteobacteria bacterium]
MCGLVGVYGPNAFKYKHRIHSANQVIKHRGPDGDGVYQSDDELCVMGHVRLAILDLSEAAAQPMKKAGSVLSYNGEIYNHSSLRQSLEQNNWHFTSTSDTETLLAGLSIEGVGFLEKARGMFAGAWYQEATKTLTLFRDPLGIKPLYIAKLADSTIVFASEIKAILAIDDTFSCSVQTETLQCYLTYENYPQSNTMIQGIECLLPGEVRCYQQSTHTQHYFNQPEPLSPLNLSYQELVTQTRDVIERSVKNHLLSDVGIGVYLSGGVDSSLVACMAARHTSDLASYTGYFVDSDSYYDERKYSRLVAEQIGSPLNEIEITANDFISHFDAIIYHQGQPRMGMGVFSQYMVARMASQERKVFLAGHGGDELFAGYPLFKAAWLMEKGWITKKCWSILSKMKKNELPWFVYLFMARAIQKKTAFAPSIFTSTALSKEGNGLFDSFMSRSNKPLEAIQNYYQTIYLPGLLLIEDTLSMAHSLETRLPLWDLDLIRWANRINMQDKMPSGQLKGLLRHVAKGVIPDALLSAPKRGFPTPLRKWFRKSLFTFAKERILSESPFLDVIMPHKEREKLLYSHRKQPLPFAFDERRAHRLWMLLCLESWSRQYRMTIA